MKIAILSTPWVAVPPAGYGGIELVVANLTEGLVKKGHEVLLFATGDSRTSARLEYYYDKALGNDLYLKNNPYYLLNHVHAFFNLIKKEKFDIIHNNAQYFPMYFLDLIDTPFLHTLHGAFYKDLKSPEGFTEKKRQLLQQFKHHAFVSISDNQRQGLPELNYIKTVYNGIKPEDFSFYPNKGKYLAWLGRITPNKGVDTAIKVAKSAGIPLKLAAFIDPGDQQYFNEKIKPMLDSNTELIGEIKDIKQKADFFGQALAMLFPIRWHEPFGLVMIEAMACGTPVIGFKKGSVPEIIQNGKSGFVVETEDKMLEAVKKVSQIDRSYCREHAINNFSVDKMVDGYLEAYKITINQHKKSYG